LAFVVRGGLVAQEFHGVAAFDQCLTFGGVAFEFDRTDFGTVLMVLAAPLRQFVVVELALDAIDRTMKQVGDGPEQIVEIGFERVSVKVAISASKMSAMAPAAMLDSGKGRGSGSPSKGDGRRVAVRRADVRSARRRVQVRSRRRR